MAGLGTAAKAATETGASKQTSCFASRFALRFAHDPHTLGCHVHHGTPEATHRWQVAPRPAFGAVSLWREPSVCVYRAFHALNTRLQQGSTNCAAAAESAQLHAAQLPSLPRTHLMKYQNLLRAHTSSRANSFIRYTFGSGSFSDGFMRPMIWNCLIVMTLRTSPASSPRAEPVRNPEERRD